MENCFQGVYIQIPFCLKKCFYCDFPSYDGKEALIQDYIEALSAEIAGSSCFCPPDTVFFGGGTPSILTAWQMEKAVNALKKNGWWTGVQERTFETNPGTVDVEKLKAFKEFGFNRISIGVQTFSGGILESVGRAHTGVQAVEAIQAAREAGFANINVDLMYGLPGQDLRDLKTNIDLTVKLGATHVSVYGLTVEEGTPLEKMLAEKILELPEALEEEMYDLIVTYLPRKGFPRYEISNYAPRNFQCRHNIIYWQYQTYKGFGSAACSFNGKERTTNTDSVEEYIEAYKLRRQIPNEVEKIDEKTAMSEFVFMGLRMTVGISTAEFKERFGKDINDIYGKVIEDNEKKGWLVTSGGRLVLTAEGMKFGNKIFLTFLPLTS